MQIRSKGPFTFAKVDLPDDNWAWSIVTDYKGPQEYGDVIVVFLEGWEPTEPVVSCMLQAFYENL